MGDQAFCLFCGVCDVLFLMSIEKCIVVGTHILIYIVLYIISNQQPQQQSSSYVDTYNQARHQHHIHPQQQRQQYQNNINMNTNSSPNNNININSQHHHHQQQPLQQQQPLVKYISIPNNHTPNWLDIIPNRRKTQQQQAQQQQQQQRYQQQNQRKRFILSLINMWEFTITIESLDYYYGGSSYSNNSYYSYNNNQHGGGGKNNDTSMMTLRTQIKKIAKNHVGQGGRKGALFEKGSMGEGIIPGEF